MKNLIQMIDFLLIDIDQRITNAAIILLYVFSIYQFDRHTNFYSSKIFL